MSTPDRGRFLYDITRLVYETENRPPLAPAVLQALGHADARLKARAPDPAGDGAASDDEGPLGFSRATDGTSRAHDHADLVPVPLTADVWSSAVFHRKVTRDDLVAAIVSDRQASFLCHGLLALDDETQHFFADHGSLLARIIERSGPVFAAFSGSLRVRGGRVVPPGAEARSGADDVSPLWEAVVGEKMTRPERFIQQLLEVSEGRLAYLYDTIGQIGPARRAFALGLWMPNAAVRAERFKALATDGVAAFREWHIRSLPFGRAGYDLGLLLSRVEAGDDGTPAEPASRGFWTRAFSARELADDSRRPQANDDDAIDAAWLAAARAF